MKKVERRDFLKLIAAIPSGMILSNLISQLENSSSSSPNIIIVVLDALTARNMSLYGYPRKTTPSIERFASRSNVYHAHYSAGTYTTPGTASLLTGTYPWTHRAINIKGLVARDRYKRNIFHLLGSHYNRVAFTQNRLTNYILAQFNEDIEQHLPRESFSKLELNPTDVEDSDHLAKFRALDDFLLRLDSTAGSLMLGTLNKMRKLNSFEKIITDDFQYSMRELIFDINNVFSALSSKVADLEKPSFCYFHLFPPHAPYLPTKEFNSLFMRNNWKPTAKPKHALKSEHIERDNKTLNEERLRYDQFIATTDAAFGMLIDQIEKAGVLENSYVILTSDHGESFERGYLEHTGPFVYEPGIHIPLIISTPGQTVRRDFRSITNSVDLLPSILHFSNLDIPDWCEGELLPGLGGTEDNTRLTFSMDAKRASAFRYLSPITVAMYQGDHKLIYYAGYNDKGSPYHDGLFELYNLKEDPEELHNIIDKDTAFAKQLQEQLLQAYDIAKQPLN